MSILSQISTLAGWLKINERIEYRLKLLSLTYKVLVTSQ